MYTGRAQLAEGIHLTEARKSAIAEVMMMGTDLSAINGGVGAIPPNVAGGIGRYVDSMATAAGSIVVTMKSTEVSPCIVGATVTLAPVPPASPNDPVKWVCSTTATCKPLTCA